VNVLQVPLKKETNNISSILTYALIAVLALTYVLQVPSLRERDKGLLALALRWFWP